MKRLQTILTLLILAVAVNPDSPACAKACKSRMTVSSATEVLESVIMRSHGGSRR
jgi:hypothetical protein